MKTISHTVINANGLTSKYAAELVAEANKYVSDIVIVADRNDKSKQADLKSIMDVFTIIVRDGETFEIDFDGEDEEKAYEGFEKLFEVLPL